MQVALTLQLDNELIEKARYHADSLGLSVDQLITNYLAELPEQPELPPITRSLLGLLAGSNLDEDDYRRHLLRKHLNSDEPQTESDRAQGQRVSK